MELVIVVEVRWISIYVQVRHPEAHRRHPRRQRWEEEGGGDSLGLDRKKLEVNPRIRFNHRGQVAMAFPLEASSAASGNDEDEESAGMLRYQFFITLDDAPFLDAKHVLFGTINGPTMFNALRIGRTDADEKSGIPADIMDDPPRIKSVKVNYHPFDDLVVTPDEKIPWRKKKDSTASKRGDGEGGKQQSAMEIRKQKRKGKRDYNVLSFGDEEREYEEEIKAAGEGGKGGNKEKKSGTMLSSRVLSRSGNAKSDASIDDSAPIVHERNNKLGQEMMEIHHDTGSRGKTAPRIEEGSFKEFDGSESKDLSNHVVPSPLGEKIDTKRTKDEQNQKKNKPAESAGGGAVEARRAKYLKSGSGSSANKKERLKREGETMARLFAFKSKVIETTKGSKKDGQDYNDVERGEKQTDDSLASRMAERAKRAKDEQDIRREEEEVFAALPGYSGQVNVAEANSEITDSSDWIGTKFKCRRHMDNDSRMSTMDKIDEDGMVGGDGRRMDDYVVLDEKMRRMGRGRRNEGAQHHHSERSQLSEKSSSVLYRHQR